MVRIIDEAQIRIKTERFLEARNGTPAPDHEIVFEVGPYDDFERSHLRGAIHMTTGNLRQLVAREAYGRGSEFLLYPSRPEFEADARECAAILEGAGYPNVLLYPAGKAQWMHDGLWTQHTSLGADGQVFDPPH